MLNDVFVVVDTASMVMRRYVAGGVRTLVTHEGICDPPEATCSEVVETFRRAPPQTARVSSGPSDQPPPSNGGTPVTMVA